MGTAPQNARGGLLGGAALLLVLLGVLAMHGVAGHGSGHASAGAAPHHASAVAHVVTHAAHELSAPVEHLAAHDSAPATWTALCLAVLAGAVLVFLTARRASGLRVRSWPPSRSAQLPGRRDRDPPSLVLLSVRRC
jgi:hypothetical protein